MNSDQINNLSTPHQGLPHKQMGMSLTYWLKVSPFRGRFRGGLVTFLTVSLFHLIFVGVLNAQSNLDAYLRLAADQNPNLKSKYKLYLAALERVNHQTALPDPTLSFGYFISPVETRVGAQRFRLSVSQMFPWMGTLKTREKMAASLAQVRFEEFMEAKNKLFQEVKVSWLRLYELEREIEITRSNLDLLRSYEPITKTKYEANLVSLADLVRVQISIKDAEVKLELLKLKRVPLSSDFNTLLNRPVDASILLIESIDPIVETNLNQDSVFAQQPRIRSIQAAIAASDHEIELAALKRKPNIGFGLDYAFVSEREGIVLEDNGKDILMPMASLSLPIFKKKNKGVQKEAQLKKESLQQRLRSIENELINDWTKADYEIQNTTKEIELYRSEIENTNVLLRVLTSEYSNNNVNFEELLRVQQQLLQLQLAEIKANVRHQEAYFKKEYLAATTLNRF